MKKWVVTLHLVSAVSMACVSRGFGAGRDAFPFLLMTPSPRAAALGESYVAVAEGPEASFYNPAGLAALKEIHLYMQAFIPPFLDNVKYSNVVFVDPMPSGTWAISGGMLHAGNFTRTVSDASSSDGFRETGDFSSYDSHLALSYSASIDDQIAVGTTFRYIRESLGDVQADGYASDFGFIYFDRKYPVNAGFSVQNIGPKSKFKDEEFNLPSLMRGGLSFHKPAQGGPSFIPDNSILSVEYFKPFRGDASLRGGIEVPVVKNLALRGGYNYALKEQEIKRQGLFPGMTFGLGLNFQTWSLDYAAVSMGDMGISHRAALDLRWGTK